MFSVPAGESLTTSVHREAVESTLAQLRKLPQVVSVSDPFSTGTISKNGQSPTPSWHTRWRSPT